MNSSKYYIEKSWVGPYDEAPTCMYCRGVGCFNQTERGQTECDHCGWNPFVSMLRIKEKYGEGFIECLSSARK